MKTLRIGSLKLLALASALFPAAPTEAAETYIWVYTRKHDWALLVPGSGTGGKVIFSRSLDTKITDRVNRGEYVQVGFNASSPLELFSSTPCAWLSSKAGTRPLQLEPLQPGSLSVLPALVSFTVPTSTKWDNLHVNISTPAGTFATRIPLGAGLPR